MRTTKVIVAALSVVLVLALAGGAVWYLNTPHTAEDQFAYAEKLEKKLRGDALTKSIKELVPQIDETTAEYRKVGSKYGLSAKAAEGLQRIAALQEKVAQDDEKALAALDELIKGYPDEEHAGLGLMEQARLIRKAADGLKTGKPEEAAKRYKDAVGKLEEYRRKFEKGQQADAALMEIGRIFQDGLGDPLIRAIESFQKLIKDYPTSDHKAEALYRLAQLMEHAKDNEKALALYGQLLEEFPKSEWADKALFARGKLLAEKMDKPKDAAKDFERIEREFPDSPLRGEARSAGGAARDEATREDGEKYSKSRYGGTTPYDTLRDKPIPPLGLLERFIKQKLDAIRYDLTVDIVPGDHRISVSGTLELVNRGEDKKDLLLMLANPFKVTEVKVGGTAVKFALENEAIRIDLPGELKKDAAATISFVYSGQFAGPVPDMEGLKAMRPGRAAATGTAPASAPATRPALPKYAYNPQLAIGDYGFGLSGGAWYPITIIGDIFDAKVTIHVPANMEAVANGALDKRAPSTREGTAGEFVFHTNNPVFGLYFAYGNYKVQQSTVGKTTYYTYFREANAPKHDAYVKVASRILDFYGSKFSDFPYEKMAIIETPLPPFLGGVGPASMMMLHQNMVAAKDVPENLLAHELAHQWFGNLVPINMMDIGYNQWLSEGFATYCDALYTEKMEGSEAMARHMQKYGQMYFQYTLMMPRGKGAIRDTDQGSPLYRPVVYEKGATVLHMLRKVMGDEKFFRLMRQWVDTYRNKPSTVDDFRRLASAVHGEDLSWFFAEWYDQTSFAHWTIGKVDISGAEKAGEAAKVHMELKQPDDLIKMPVDVMLIGAGGEHEIVANQMLDKKEQTLDLAAPFKPVKIVLDHDFWVLRHPGSGNIWPPVEEKAAAATP
jgi:TolA-binding protein